MNLTGRPTEAPDRPTVTAEGRQVVDLRLAVNHHRRDTMFVDVTCWEGVDEAAADHLTKGSLVGVTGGLARDVWTNKATGEHSHRCHIKAAAWTSSTSGSTALRATTLRPPRRRGGVLTAVTEIHPAPRNAPLCSAVRDSPRQR